MSDNAVILAMCGFAALWFTLLWLALRQSERGNPRKKQHDKARDT